jgi:hypothetical protein
MNRLAGDNPSVEIEILHTNFVSAAGLDATPCTQHIQASCG